MSPDLPPALRQGVDALLNGVRRSGLAARSSDLSDGYRAGKASKVVIRSAEDAAAYAAARLPATYAAVARALSEADARLVDFQPTSLLDAGSGPGAAGWAATQLWDSLETAVLLDSSRIFLDLAERLATQGPPALAQAERRLVDLTQAGAWPRVDLVLASYVLAELPQDKIPSVVERLWSACGGLLVLVEPGSGEGWGRIKLARDRLIALDAVLVAPCAHALPCPIQAPDWCHFVQRLPRSRDHRQAKGAERPFEDEKFIYLIAARPELTLTGQAPRILAPPRASKIGIDFKICTTAGTCVTRTVERRDKANFPAARRLDWGDLALGDE